MAKVPDLGSDFAQKLLQDLRRRRERLGFESSAQRTSNTAAPQDAHSSSQRPLRSQKPLQGAPRVARAEATTNRSHQQQSGNAIARAGKPRHGDAPTSHSHHIVPFQGGGGGSKQNPASNIDMQMALALSLSNNGKLQNIELVARNGAMFFREPDRENYLLSRSAHVGKVAIGVQKLNEILMAYSSGADARSSVEVGKQLFRGAMDLEESLSMLVMLQEASDYMEGSGHGKVLLLEDKENPKKSTRSTSSARLVEIVDEDSETEQDMQIVAHTKNSQSFSTDTRSVLQLSTVTRNSKSNASEGEKDGSKMRTPNVIAKLMGLENLPSMRVVAEHKGTERFVKSGSVPRKDKRTNATSDKFPIQIVGSERVFAKGQNLNFLAREWKIGLKNSEESEIANGLSNNSSSFPTNDKQTRQTMKQMLSNMESTERRGSGSLGQGVQGVKILTEESKLLKAVSVGCRTDSGRKMDFLKRFRKNSDSRQVTEEKHTIQENNTTLGKKQSTNMKRWLGRDSEAKSRRTREKFDKENHAATEIKAAGKKGKPDQIKRKPYSKLTDKQSMKKKVQNYPEMQIETASRNIENKKPMKLEATQVKKKIPYTVEIEHENAKLTEVSDIGSSKPSDGTHGDGDIYEESARGMKESRTTEVASSDQFVKQIIEEINDPTMAIVHISDESNVVDQSAAQTIEDRTNHTASTQIPETFAEGEKKQQQQQNLQQIVEVKEELMDGLDHTRKSSNPAVMQDQKMHIVSCDAFTENQLLIMKMLLKDKYLLETAKAIVRIHVPVNFANAGADKWSEKGNNLFSDVAREVIRRKGKRTEAMVEVSMTRTANMKLQCLDDLIIELDGDIENLNISKKPHQQGDDNTAENLQKILHRDIQNNHRDANSTWDFGWNRISDLPIEKNEVVRDLEKNILGGIITDVARELIEISVHHGCCTCEA